jgi:hypothetical protein
MSDLSHSHGARNAIRGEAEMQDAISRWLTEQKLPFHQSRMDRETTGPIGWPDFGIFKNGKCLFIETKFEKGKLSADQIACHEALSAAGCKVHVCRSVGAAIELVKAWSDTLGEALQLQSNCTANQLRIVNYPGHGDFVVSGATQVRKATIEDLKTIPRK